MYGLTLLLSVRVVLSLIGDKTPMKYNVIAFKLLVTVHLSKRYKSSQYEFSQVAWESLSFMHQVFFFLKVFATCASGWLIHYVCSEFTPRTTEGVAGDKSAIKGVIQKCKLSWITGRWVRSTYGPLPSYLALVINRDTHHNSVSQIKWVVPAWITRHFGERWMVNRYR